MRAKLTLIILMLALNFNSKAQYVTIPDANFVTWLTSNFPTCMSGNQMDTTCAGITGATQMDVSGLSISDLTGVQYFTSMQSLDCSFNYTLTSLPTLPNSLHDLYIDDNSFSVLPLLPNGLSLLSCHTNHITSLPVLPLGLTYLECSYNQLSSLPALPSVLGSLLCGNNQLISLPSLPNSLTDLECMNNKLSSLSSLPSGLTTLICGDSLLNSLPVLPSTLNVFVCQNSLITSLPVLPSSLYYINCINNHITTFPTFPLALSTLDCRYNLIDSLPPFNAHLMNLTCSHNHLISLPTFNTNLVNIDCSYNNLINLPSMNSGLHTIDCSFNNITALPTLPDSLYGLTANNNSITCVPIFSNNLNVTLNNNLLTCVENYISGMDWITLGLPLCVSGNSVTNPNNCASAPGIVGYSYKDINGDCTYDTLDTPESNIPILLYDSGNNLISQTYTLLNGIYDFPKPIGTYIVKVDTTGKPYTAQCAFPGIDSTVVLTNLLPLAQNVNFDYNCKPGFDIGVQSIYHHGMAFPGHEHSVHIVAGDMSNWYNLHCAAGVSGQVAVTVTGPVTYDSITYGALTPSIVGNVFTYSIPDFGIINNYNAFGLNFTTDTTMVGVPICVNVSVTPTIGDNNSLNNTFSYCYVVDSSSDPNFKETYPVNVPLGFNDYFYYTIHFQNVGTAAAANIHLRDTLDTNLDLNTFEVIGYSHPNTTWLTNRNLSVYFTNINLPNIASDFNGSQGYIQYRIKPKSNRPAGTQVHNKASIYFDYNAAVVTNTTLNQFATNIGISEISGAQAQVAIFPNPSNGKFAIEIDNTNNQNFKIEVTNLLGELVYQAEIHTAKSEIDLTNQSCGIYFVRVIGRTHTLNQKVIKQ
ncbi:MAG: T9SS type A sorting domain-containing protein [Bacteroidota bacterium]